MRLYHRTNLKLLHYLALFFITFIAWGCSSPRTTPSPIIVTVKADGSQSLVTIMPGSTVSDAVTAAGINLGTDDMINLSPDTILTADSILTVTRVKDEYYTEQIVIPFEQQVIKNDVLPEGERRLSQAGENGLEEITYHRVLEDGLEVSNIQVNSTVIKEPVPEIVMLGNRSAFSPVHFPGKIAYLSAGNAWIIESNSGNRNCVVCTGDLDGRIFKLSPNGSFILFTRKSTDPNTINTLWAASLSSNSAMLIDLGVENIVNYAEFAPDSSTISYSTAEWREAAPGWQANNDLMEMTVSKSGFLGKAQLDLEANSGGVYGWWGTLFSWAPRQNQFAYARPDGIGLLDPQDGIQSTLHSIIPYQTGSYWAWVPGITWSPDALLLYTIDHQSVNTSEGVEYQEFDMIALPIAGGEPINLVKNVGMFAYPTTSPLTAASNLPGESSSVNQGDRTFLLAYLQAIFPDQSENSGYRLFVVNRDGTNPTSLFPEEGEAGLKPQQVVWSPDIMENDEKFAIAAVYNGNIWLIHTGSGTAQQITSDGLTSRIDWR